MAPGTAAASPRKAALAGTAAPPNPAADRTCWWVLPALVVLWVNLDSWFLLGPLTVGLYLLGEILQHWINGARVNHQEAAPGSLKALSFVFAASLAAGLLNPFHVHAYTLPPQLGLFSEGAEILQQPGSYFAVAFVAPLDLHGFYFNSGIGLSAAGLSFFLLLLLGIVSLVLAGQQRWPRLPLFTVYALLACWHARAIPFFAIVAGPILALNWLDAISARSRAMPLTSGPWTRWLVLGRGLSLVAILVLLLASVPGWLQVRPHVLRRIGWGIQPEASLVRAARQMADWRDRGLLPDNVNWCNTNPDLANYAYFFCPGQKMFFDHRIDLYSPVTTKEFVDLSRGLADPDGKTPGSQKAVWRTLFRDRGMQFLLFHEASLAPLLASMKFQSLANSEESALLYMDGRTVIAGWLDPDLRSGAAVKDPYEGMRLNLDREAFGPMAVPAPGERSVRAPYGREWYTEFWDPTPMPSLDADYAQMCYHYFLGQGKTYYETNRLRRETTLASRLLAVGLQSGDPLLSGLTLPFQSSFMAGLSTCSHEPFSRPATTAGQQGGPRPVPGSMEQLAQGLVKNDLSTKDAGPASASTWACVPPAGP